MKDFRTDPQAGFDFTIRAFYSGGCILAPALGVILISDYLLAKRVIPEWVWLAATVLPLVGLYGGLRYRLRPTLRNLFLLVDCTALSCLLLLIGEIWNSGLMGKMSWIYSDHVLLYLSIFVCAFAIPLLMPWLRPKATEQYVHKYESLEPYYARGTISAGDVYRIWFQYAGAEQWQKGGKYATFMGVMATGGVVAFALGRGEYVLFYSFVLSLFAGPVVLGGIISRRRFQNRYLRLEDLAIVRSY